jgi:hypothetical protein
LPTGSKPRNFVNHQINQRKQNQKHTYPNKHIQNSSIFFENELRKNKTFPQTLPLNRFCFSSIMQSTLLPYEQINKKSFRASKEKSQKDCFSGKAAKIGFYKQQQGF